MNFSRTMWHVVPVHLLVAVRGRGSRRFQNMVELSLFFLALPTVIVPIYLMAES